MPKRGLIKVEDWDSVVSAIYDSAINPNRWTDVIEAVGRLTHAPSGVLHCVEHQPQTTRAGSVLLEYNTDPYWSVQYKQHYASLNPAIAKAPVSESQPVKPSVVAPVSVTIIGMP